MSGQDGLQKKKFIAGLDFPGPGAVSRGVTTYMMKNQLHVCKASRPTAERFGMAVRSDRRATYSTVINAGWNREHGSGVI